MILTEIVRTVTGRDGPGTPPQVGYCVERLWRIKEDLPVDIPWRQSQ